MNESARRVLEQYRSLYERPPIYSTRPFLLCPVGLVGSGKSTVITPLARTLGLSRISGDEIRKLLKEAGEPYDAVHDIAAILIEEEIRNGHAVAIDSDCASSHTQELIARISKECGALAFYLHIHPPEAFIIDKLMRYEHTWLFKNGEEAVENYRQRKALHEHLSLPFVYTFDPSREDLPLQLKEAEDRLRDLVASTGTKRKAAGGIVLGDKGMVALVKSKNGNGYFFFPKGHQKADETDEETARREIAEETGITNLELLADLGIYERPSVKNKSETKQIHMYLFAAPPRALLIPGNEIQDVRWYHYQKAAEAMGHDPDRVWYAGMYERVREAFQRD